MRQSHQTVTGLCALCPKLCDPFKVPDLCICWKPDTPFTRALKLVLCAAECKELLRRWEAQPSMESTSGLEVATYIVLPGHWCGDVFRLNALNMCANAFLIQSVQVCNASVAEWQSESSTDSHTQSFASDVLGTFEVAHWQPWKQLNQYHEHWFYFTAYVQLSFVYFNQRWWRCIADLAEFFFTLQRAFLRFVTFSGLTVWQHPPVCLMFGCAYDDACNQVLAVLCV